MANSIMLHLTHTGMVQSSLLLADLQSYLDSRPVTEPKAGPVYVPVGETIELLLTDRVAFSYLGGTIAGFISQGFLTALFSMNGLLQAASDGPALVVATAGPPTPYAVTGTPSDSLFLVSTVANSVQVTLPAGSAHLRGRFRVVDIGGNASVNNIIIVPPAGGGTIEGGASYTLITDNGQAEFLWDGVGNWFIPANVGAAPAHDLGGASHLPDTLANLNTKLSDATLIDPAQTFVVAQSGGDYTTIEDGLAAAAAVATTSNRVLVEVYPGDYTEANPLTVPDYTAIHCPGSHEVTRMLCANPGAGDHGVVLGTDTHVFGLQVQDAIGASAGGFYFPAGIHDAELHDCKVNNCDIGYFSEAGTPNPAVFIRAPHASSGTFTTMFQVSNGGRMLVSDAVATGGVTCDTFVKADGAGSKLVVYGCQMGGPNFTRVGEVSNTAELEVQLFRVLRADEGFFVLSSGGQLSLGSTQITDVAGTQVSLADSLDVYGFLNDVYFDDSKLVKGAQATLTGIYDSASVDRTGPTIIGELWLGTDPAEQIPLASYTRDTAWTAWTSGGVVSVNAGLLMDVALGTGYINTGTGVVQVEWAAQQVTATADSPFYVYIDSAGTAQIATSEPSLYMNIILASGRADATGVVFLARNVIPAEHALVGRHEYTATVIGSTWISGMAVTELGGPSLAFTVGSGAFYLSDLEVAVNASASPCSFNYWYRDGAGWDITVGATALDDANYDPAGAGLVAIPAGEWVKCAVYTTANNGTTSWHVVYPQASYASQVLAEAASLPVPPDVFDSSALPCGAFTFQVGSGDISSILDIRPVITTAGPGSAAAPASHSALADLSADDHSQYVSLTGNAARNPLTGTLDAAGGTVLLPTAAVPVQTAEGSIVWDSDDDVLTVGTGAARKIMVDTNSAQTLVNKTFTNGAVTDFISFTPIAAPAYAEGQVYYDSTDKTLNVDVAGGSRLQIGQEMYLRAYNGTGAQINDGEVVYVNGAFSNRPTVAPAIASSYAPSLVIGVATQNIGIAGTGTITTYGLVRGLDTTGPGLEVWAAGDLVYLSPTTAGGLTNVAPVSPNYLVLVGRVLNADAINGLLLVDPRTGWSLNELYDVYCPTPADGNVLQYEGATSLWKNVAPAGIDTTAVHSGDAAGGSLSGTYPNPSVTPAAGLDTTAIHSGDAAGGGLGGTYPNPSVTPAAGLDTTAIQTGDAAGGDLGGTYPNPTVVPASLILAGKIELATQTEVNAGADAVRAVTPSTLAAATTVIKTGQAAGGGLEGTYPNPTVIFGSGFQQVSAEGETTTTAAGYTTKVTLTTGALTGTYRLAFSVEIKASAKDKQAPVRLYNSTDAVEYCFDAGDKEEADAWEATSGFIYVTLAGVSKNMVVQFASPEGVTVTCRRARIEFWRVA